MAMADKGACTKWHIGKAKEVIKRENEVEICHRAHHERIVSGGM